PGGANRPNARPRALATTAESVAEALSGATGGFCAAAGSGQGIARYSGTCAYLPLGTANPTFLRGAVSLVRILLFHCRACWYRRWEPGTVQCTESAQREAEGEVSTCVTRLEANAHTPRSSPASS